MNTLRWCSCKASARDGQHMAWCPAEADAKCAACGHEKGEHHYNGSAYGVCGKFVDAMNDDIVQRLRAAGHNALMDEAADEIERLRNALLEIAEACERATHPAAEICLSETHLDSLLQIAAKARSALQPSEG